MLMILLSFQLAILLLVNHRSLFKSMILARRKQVIKSTGDMPLYLIYQKVLQR